MWGAAHDLPCIAQISDMPPPGNGLITNPKAPAGRPFAQNVQIGRHPVDPAQGCRIGTGAQLNQIAAQLRHLVKAALYHIQCALAQDIRHAFIADVHAG